jgi:hypothetical protein
LQVAVQAVHQVAVAVALVDFVQQSHLQAAAVL